MTGAVLIYRVRGSFLCYAWLHAKVMILVTFSSRAREQTRIVKNVQGVQNATLIAYVTVGNSRCRNDGIGELLIILVHSSTYSKSNGTELPIPQNTVVTLSRTFMYPRIPE